MCKFVNFAIGDDFFARLVTAVTGTECKTQDLQRIGERIWNLERLYNQRAGFVGSDDTLPSRLLNTPLADGPSAGHVVRLDEMLAEYYRFRGWTPDGRPTPGKLAALGLGELAARHMELDRYA